MQNEVTIDSGSVTFLGRQGATGLLQLTEEKAFSNPYQLLLINLSTRWTCFAISFDRSSWHATPLVGRTCSYACTDADLQRCFNERKWAGIAQVNCGPEYKVWLRFKDGQGSVAETRDPWTFIADCRYAGGVLAFCD